MDIGNNKKSMGNWFSGKPVIIIFDDVVVNPEKKYFIELSWIMSSTSTNYSGNYTPYYKFNNKANKMKISEMALYDNDMEPNHVDDLYQLWNDPMDPPVANFSAYPLSGTEPLSVTFTVCGKTKSRSR